MFVPRRKWFGMLAIVAMLPLLAVAQQAAPVKGADERYKTDILVVVAHPDDEGGVTPYLARAIFDEHKRVSVVYGTRGGSGGNDAFREHGPALADVREMEARKACAMLGISHVWFLGGKDTASQNVLNSLGNWGHGASLEELVRIVRLTKPEVIITWLPSIFVGENHGDHQAAGVLATEAFSMAADPTVFPAQVAGDTKRLEAYLENLTPWQPKKIYYFSDANNQKQFAGTGPSYSIKEVSPSQKKPYWRLAIDAATPHVTQFPGVDQMSKMSDADLEKMIFNPETGFWQEPFTLIFGKSKGETKTASDVFADLDYESRRPPEIWKDVVEKTFGHKKGNNTTQAILGGPWLFYEKFRDSYNLQIPVATEAEIGVKAGTSIYVPYMVLRPNKETLQVKVSVDKPENWKVTYGEGLLALPAETSTALRVEIATPELSKDELKNVKPQDVVVHVTLDGKSIGDVKLKVTVQSGGLPQ